MGTYIKQVGNSLINYNNARNKRKELFGPTLFDTALEVGEITYKNVKERVINLTESFREKHSEKFEENLDSIRKFLASNYNKHFRGKLTKFKDLFKTPEQELEHDPRLEEFKEKLLEDSKKPISKKPKQKAEFLDENEEFSAKQFAKMYHRSNDKASIKEDVLKGEDFNQTVTNVIHTNNLHYGSFRSGIAVFFDTLKNAKPLNYDQMNTVVDDMEELDDIDIQMEELQSKIDELKGRKTKIEDKYELVSPKERVRLAYMNVLQNSSEFIDVQTKFADELDIDKEVLQINAKVTQEEIERINAEKEEDFDEYLVKKTVEETDEAEDGFEKDLEQFNEVTFTKTLEELNEIEESEEDDLNFVQAISDLDEDIKPNRKNMYTRKN